MPGLKLFIYLSRYILKVSFLKLFVIFLSQQIFHIGEGTVTFH